jgi:hypothetical protein
VLDGQETAQIWTQLRIFGMKSRTVSGKHFIPLSNSSMRNWFKSGTMIKDLSS